ncbi:MAG: hypothetical protein HY053_08165 [Proteobacteria bacterium]|nr:hypothetical protein [Pseudomonadota bacterium]
MTALSQLKATQQDVQSFERYADEICARVDTTLGIFFRCTKETLGLARTDEELDQKDRAAIEAAKQKLRKTFLAEAITVLENGKTTLGEEINNIDDALRLAYGITNLSWFAEAHRHSLVLFDRHDAKRLGKYRPVRSGIANNRTDESNLFHAVLAVPIGRVMERRDQRLKAAAGLGS